LPALINLAATITLLDGGERWRTCGLEMTLLAGMRLGSAKWEHVLMGDRIDPMSLSGKTAGSFRDRL